MDVQHEERIIKPVGDIILTSRDAGGNEEFRYEKHNIVVNNFTARTVMAMGQQNVNGSQALGKLGLGSGTSSDVTRTALVAPIAYSTGGQYLPNENLLSPHGVAGKTSSYAAPGITALQSTVLNPQSWTATAYTAAHLETYRGLFRTAQNMVTLSNEYIVPASVGAGREYTEMGVIFAGGSPALAMLHVFDHAIYKDSSFSWIVYWSITWTISATWPSPIV